MSIVLLSFCGKRLCARAYPAGGTRVQGSHFRECLCAFGVLGFANIYVADRGCGSRIMVIRALLGTNFRLIERSTGDAVCIAISTGSNRIRIPMSFLCSSFIFATRIPSCWRIHRSRVQGRFLFDFAEYLKCIIGIFKWIQVQ